jgi:glycosyltransferase involved in cell wall biosynthesis
MSTLVGPPGGIKYGIKLDAFQNAVPADSLPGSGVRVLMVSRLAEGKGFDVLFDAVERINAEALSVFIAGDGPLFNELQSEIRSRGIDDCVFLLGYRDDIPRVMVSSDMLVLPSYREGTPLVILEAMAAGLPVIATDIAGIPEQIENGANGFLIPPGDADALATQIERLLSSPGLREQFGAAGRRRSSQFSRDRMIEDYSSLYRELLSTSDK